MAGGAAAQKAELKSSQGVGKISVLSKSQVAQANAMMPLLPSVCSLGTTQSFRWDVVGRAISTYDCLFQLPSLELNS